MSNLEKLQFLCKAENLSFIFMYDNHRRFGLTPRQYMEKFHPDGFQNELGQQQIQEFESRSSIISIEIFDNQMRCRFICFDVNLDRCLEETIAGIQAGIVLNQGDQWIDGINTINTP